MLLTLQNLQYHIRKAYIELDTLFGPKSNIPPFQGPGQGNSASGGPWATIIIVLLKILRKEGYGAQCISLLSKELTNLAGFAFGDDTYLIHILLDQSITRHELSKAMQEALDLWEYSLRLTGCDFVPNKSWVHSISFSWPHSG